MKRLATATVLLAALAAGAQAGSLPKPIRMVDRMKMYSPTHYVRGAQGGGGSGGYASSTAEARQQAPAPKPTQTPQPEKPAKAD